MTGPLGVPPDPTTPYCVAAGTDAEPFLIDVAPVPSLAECVAIALDLSSLGAPGQGRTGTNQADRTELDRILTNAVNVANGTTPRSKTFLEIAELLVEPLLFVYRPTGSWLSPDEIKRQGLSSEQVEEIRLGAHRELVRARRDKTEKRQAATIRPPRAEAAGLPGHYQARLGRAHDQPGAFFQVLAAFVHLQVVGQDRAWSFAELAAFLQFRDGDRLIDLSGFIREVLDVLWWWGVLVHTVPDIPGAIDLVDRGCCPGLWVPPLEPGPPRTWGERWPRFVLIPPVVARGGRTIPSVLSAAEAAVLRDFVSAKQIQHGGGPCALELADQYCFEATLGAWCCAQWRRLTWQERVNELNPRLAKLLGIAGPGHDAVHLASVAAA